MISEKIKELRLKKSIDRKTLAKAIGVNERTIRHWESGSRMKASYIIKLARYFEVSADNLLNIED